MRRGWLVGLVCLLAACGDREEATPEIWIYTSIYQHVIDAIQPHLEDAVPEARIRFFRKGSEQVAARLGMELEAGSTPCDLLVTSDPFYYAELTRQGRLLAYASPAATSVPAHLRDPGNAWVTVRIPLMVLGVNTESLAVHERPTGFADLAAPSLESRIAMGDPLKSGTNFTTVAALAHRPGWPLLEGWSRNGIVAAGGNSTVLDAIERGERPVGVVLLENLLPAQRRGAPIQVVYPREGAIPVPSPIAILASTAHPALARRVYDAMFSPAVQAAIVAGDMYSPLPDAEPPPGARRLADVPLFPWDASFLDEASSRRREIKERFREIMRR